MSIENLYATTLQQTPHIAKVYAYYFTQWRGFEMKVAHEHPWMEIMYVVHGKCGVQLEDHFYPMKSGDFIFINSGVFHQLIQTPEESCRMLNLEFGFESIPPSSTKEETYEVCPIRQLIQHNSCLKSLITERPSYMLLKDIDEVFPILMNLVNELSIDFRKNEDLIQLYIAQLLLMISRQSQTTHSSDSFSDQYIRQVIHYMNQHYDRPIRIENIASEVNLHPSYLHRIFKKATGSTINQYLTGIRMEKAKMLLERTEIPIIDISDYIGLGSRQYFSSVFKKSTRMSPLEYRKQVSTNTPLS